MGSEMCIRDRSHDVDMQNPVCWLEKGLSGYSLPDRDQVNPIRLCVQPCQLQFRSQAAHAKSDQESTTNTKNNPVQYMHMKVRAVTVCVASLLNLAGSCQCMV